MRFLPLSEACDVISGQHIESSLYNDQVEGVPYLTGPADFSERVPIISKWTKHPKIFASAADVLVTVKGAGVGKTNMGVDAAIGRQLMALRPVRGQLDQVYLFHFMKFSEGRINRLAEGATVPGITRGDLQDLRVPLPPLAEQRRIAAILDAADTLRAKRRAALAKLDTLAQSIFIEMFESGDWQEVPLSAYLLEVKMGPFGSLLHRSDYADGGVPLVNPMHIVDGDIVADPAYSISPEKAQELSGYLLRHGDVVIGRRGEMGRCAVVDLAAEGFLCGTGSMVLRPDPRKADAYFVSELIRSQNVVKQIEQVASGVTMLNLNSKSLDRVLVSNVPLDDQRMYFERVGRVRAVRPPFLRALQHLDTIFASLRHRAFAGKL